MLTWMTELFNSFGSMLMTVLPRSPFAGVLFSLAGNQGLGWLNWFFPVGACLKVFAAWLVAYGTYLVYSIIMRWIKAIE